MNFRKTSFTLAMIAASFCCWAVPIVSNVHMEQIEGTKDVRITYDLADNFNTQLWVSASIQLLTNVATWSSSALPVKNIEGDVGWIEPGIRKEIVWHAGTDWNGRYTDSAKAYIDAQAMDNFSYNICSTHNLKITKSSSNWNRSGSTAYTYAKGVNSINTAVFGSGRLIFEWYIAQTSGTSSYLRFFVDGSTSASSAISSTDSRNYGKWITVTNNITRSGCHTFEWSYYNNVSASYEAQIRNVRWE